jgi:hypothetical protein
MIHFDKKPLLARHPNFKITTLDEVALRAELSGWSRMGFTLTAQVCVSLGGAHD